MFAGAHLPAGQRPGEAAGRSWLGGQAGLPLGLPRRGGLGVAAGAPGGVLSADPVRVEEQVAGARRGVAMCSSSRRATAALRSTRRASAPSVYCLRSTTSPDALNCSLGQLMTVSTFTYTGVRGTTCPARRSVSPPQRRPGVDRHVHEELCLRAVVVELTAQLRPLLGLEHRPPAAQRGARGRPHDVHRVDGPQAAVDGPLQHQGQRRAVGDAAAQRPAGGLCLAHPGADHRRGDVGDGHGAEAGDQVGPEVRGAARAGRGGELLGREVLLGDLGERPPAATRITTAGAAAGGVLGVLPGVGREREGVDGAELNPEPSSTAADG